MAYLRTKQGQTQELARPDRHSVPQRKVTPPLPRVRIATHIFTQTTELNAHFDALDRGLRK